MLACSSTTVWGQLPSQKVSPLNQLGRCWGFGISDGYHECPSCEEPKPRAKETVRPVSEKSPRECKQCQKPSPFVLVNPFKSKKKQADAGGVFGNAGKKSGTIQMTVLPPTPDMYLNFAAPHETPLPGSSDQTTAIDTSNASIRQPPATSPWPTATANESAVLDPVEQESAELNVVRDEPPQTADQVSVPPSPTFRTQPNWDKPFRDEPKTSKPEATGTPEPGLRVDDHLDLLPKDETPPITQHSQQQPERSLLSNAPAIDNAKLDGLNRGNDWMVQQYYGKAYSRSQMPIELEANRTLMNRYR